MAAAVQRAAAAIAAAQNDLLQPPPNVPPAVAAAQRLVEVSTADASAAVASIQLLTPAAGNSTDSGEGGRCDPVQQLALVQHSMESLRLGAVGIATSLQAEASASRLQTSEDAGKL